MIVPTDLIALARTIAAKQALDSALSASSVICTGTALVCAIIEQESAWDAHAIRYEPGFRSRYVAPLGLPPTEEVARSISWGLMQVMGQVAREHGFSGKFLSAPCDPATGLDIGCAVLASKLSASAANVERALELWNGGANADYASQVLARLANYE
jgi:soluble lytic murein transglycosylase-like protein